MAKVTKQTLLKENEALKKRIKELEGTVEQLNKDKLVLQVKIDWYESLPKQAGDCINNATQWLMGVAFPTQQAQK